MAFVGVWTLAVKSPRLDVIFGGIDRMLRLHRWVATWAAIAVIGHVAIQVLDMGFPGVLDSSLISAWLAVVSLGFVIWMARKPSPSKRQWVRWHSLSHFVFIFSFAHIWVFRAESGWHRWVVTILLMLWFLLWVRAQWLPRLKNWGMPATVTAVRTLSTAVTELTLAPKVRRPFVFELGQFWNLRFPYSSTWHPFSVVGYSDQGELRFAIKSVGVDTRRIGEIRLGDTLQVEGPFGHWAQTSSASQQLWLVAGMGVTPLLAWTQDARFQSQASRPGAARVVLALESESDFLYPEWWTELRRRCPELDVRFWFRDSQGPWGGAQVQDWIRGFENAEVWIAGPPGWVAKLRSQLAELGIASRYLHSEDFVQHSSR